MIVIGAGLAGLLSAYHFTKAGYSVLVWEAQNELPNNHSAVLRFRTDKVSRLVDIPFREVTVKKEIFYEGFFVDRPNVYLSNKYSLKVTGQVLSRSIGNIDPVTRYIAPENFIELLFEKLIAMGVKFQFGQSFKEAHTRQFSSMPIISTIPIPVMSKILGMEVPDLAYKSNHIWNIVANIADTNRADVFQTIYFPDPNVDQYRASITGAELVIECIREPTSESETLFEVLDTFGLEGVDILPNWELKRQTYGKIAPVKGTYDSNRKAFIWSLTNRYNIYSVGRFATWRQILLDDVVDDLKVVQGLIRARQESDRYSSAIALGKVS